jgi:hypothetical protein
LKKNMSGNKNIKNSLAEFFRYIRNELSGKDRNIFERGIQRDPFAEEALEGFSTISEKEAAEDISVLNESIRQRTVRKSGSILYRIAGIVVLLLAISAVLFITYKKPESQLALNTPAPESIEIIRNQAIIVSDSKDNAVSDRAREDKKSIVETEQSTTGAARITGSSEKQSVTLNEIATPEEAVVSRDELSKKLIVSAPASAMARKRSFPSDSALSEVIVIGYSSRKSDKEEEDISEYLHPQPSIGKAEFDEYVKNNLHRPDTADGGKKMVVVLNFLVHTNGRIDSFRIIKSPGKVYSDEAIRVIKAGPAWNPATDNGKAVEEDVRLRIVFK